DWKTNPRLRDNKIRPPMGLRRLREDRMFSSGGSLPIILRTVPLAIALWMLMASIPPLHANTTKIPSFRNDVMAVLSKAGCNAGACHGNKSGKGGFKLSLRGQDPDADFDTLSRDVFARRTDPLDPDRSLVLLKPTNQISHEGGLRFRRDSELYQILRSWIAAGMPRDNAATPTLLGIDVTPIEQVLLEPSDQLQIHVSARFSDGSSRDVTRLA